MPNIPDNPSRTLSDNQKKDYKELMKKQYQNLTYTIKDEEVDGNNAIVKVEIEVKKAQRLS